MSVILYIDVSYIVDFADNKIFLWAICWFWRVAITV